MKKVIVDYLDLISDSVRIWLMISYIIGLSVLVIVLDINFGIIVYKGFIIIEVKLGGLVYFVIEFDVIKICFYMFV